MISDLPPDLWESQAGDVPAVSPNDLKKVLRLSAEFEARNPGQCGSIGSTVYESVCSPGADVMSLWYRASMLWVLKQMIPGQVAKWTYDGQLDGVVSEVLATFPMKRMRTGMTYEQPPFDVEEFVKQVGART